jgi:Dihydroorotase and related cyclic amidohydrolases
MNKTRAAAAFLLAALACVAAEPPVLIRNATILTITRGTLKGSVLVRNGKIAEVGEN